MPNFTTEPSTEFLSHLPGALRPLAQQAQARSGLTLHVSQAEPGSHAWSACLPGQALIHPGPTPDTLTWAHELAHVQVAAQQNCVRPVPLSPDPAITRRVWLIFNAVCDVFVYDMLEQLELLPTGHRARAADAYRQLVPQNAPHLGLPELAPFYRDHAEALISLRTDLPSDLARQYLMALGEEHGLEPLTEHLLNAFLAPDGRVEWIRMDDLNSQGTFTALLQERSGEWKEEAPVQAQTGQAFAARLAGSIRSRRPFALLMWDVSGLGTINAEHGVATGDQVLERHGHAVATAHQQPWYRNGGDESYLMLDDAHPADRQNLLHTTLLALATAGTPVTAEVRLAVAFFPHDAPDLQALLRRLEHRAFAGTLSRTRSPLTPS